MAQEGAPLAVIDRVAEEFGMPIGPVELADTVGLDVAQHVGRILGEAFDIPVSKELDALVEQKRLGRKTGRGFYACLREGIVADAGLIDAGIVFGTGFAPFRGGPIHYAKTRGVPEIVKALETLAARHGDRFKPDGGWALLGQADET